MSAVHREHKLSASIRSILSPKTGSSGAEKTMLLHVLSGRPTSNAKFTVQAQVGLNQTFVDPKGIYICHKIVSLKTTPSPTPAHITILECLLFSAKSRMTCNTSSDAKHEALTERMLRVLGLEACSHVCFGGGG
jgi:ABC-type multidrug transport system ATPase subunit